MGVLDNLKKKAGKALQIFRNRFGADESLYVPETLEDFSPRQQAAQEKKHDLFDFLKETYIDIAESDPELALRMIKDELMQKPEKPVEEALIEIERHIRGRFCSEYFRGVRVKKD